MKYLQYVFHLIFVLFLIFQIANGAENDYGIVKAWFNGKNATSEGDVLKVGEPAEIKVEIFSKINGIVGLELNEPGVTKAFKVNGPSNLDESIVNYNVTNDWSKTYTWTITPNGAWKNGNAPINIFVQFNKIVNGKITNDKTIQFTIANPYILDEQYTGSPTTTTTSSAPKTTEPGAPMKTAPFLSLLAAAFVLLLARRWR